MDLESVRHRIPGVALCALLAVPCWFLGKAFPIVGGPVFGILLGMVVALAWKEHGNFQGGIQFTSKKILQYAVILLGLGLNLSQHSQDATDSTVPQWELIKCISNSLHLYSPFLMISVFDILFYI